MLLLARGIVANPLKRKEKEKEKEKKRRKVGSSHNNEDDKLKRRNVRPGHLARAFGKGGGGIRVAGFGVYRVVVDFVGGG